MGTYASQTDLERHFGAQNIQRWSNLSNTATTVDTDRVAWAIGIAEESINDRFRDSRYTIPFSPVPAMVTSWAARIAGLMLYDSRGARDDGVDPYERMREDTESEMQAYLSQARRFDCSVKQTQARVPWAIGGGG